MSAAPNTDSSAWTVGKLLDWTTGFLRDRNVDDARLASEVLLAHALECQRIALYTHLDRMPEAEQLTQYRDWVKRAGEREPIAYLVGEKEFYSLPLHVTRDVLIPRPETELLVECVVDHCAGNSNPTVFDLGTGSGCIAIAILKQVPNAKVVASDCSPAALEVARSNAERHGVLDRIELVEADRFALPDGVVPETGFDVLVSNPPYVPLEEMAGLDANVRDYEPHVALSDGGDGLSFYEEIAHSAGPILATDGTVFVEVGDGRADAVRVAMTKSGELHHVRTWSDRVVGQERVLMLAAGAEPFEANTERAD